MIDQRNAYGFPVLFRVERTKQIARQTSQATQTACTCDACIDKEKEQAVIRMINNWSKK